MPIRPDPVSGVVPVGGEITGLADGEVVTLPLPGVGLGETLLDEVVFGLAVTLGDALALVLTEALGVALLEVVC